MRVQIAKQIQVTRSAIVNQAASARYRPEVTLEHLGS
jgi:hypothetical protein